MPTNTKTYSAGFVALLSVVSIGLVLLTVTLALTQTGWYTRTRVLEREWKDRSIIAAHRCRTEVVALVIADVQYVGNATVPVGDGSCYIYPVERNIPVAGMLTVRVRATFHSVQTTLMAIYDMHDIHLSVVPDTVPASGGENFSATVVNWHEVP